VSEPGVKPTTPSGSGPSGSGPAFRWSWPLESEGRAARGDPTTAQGGAGGSFVWLTLPERLIGPEPADCEVVLGEDYGARVLERVLSRGSWWLWWTEGRVLARVERQWPGVRQARHLPREAPQGSGAPSIARGMFHPFGAALLPPRAELQASVLEETPSQYSEHDPNFVLSLSPGAPGSPRWLERWCAEAKPGALSLEPLTHGADRVCMLWNGDISIGLPEADAITVVGAIEAWAQGYGVALERR
jgi:hypothetical protein